METVKPHSLQAWVLAARPKTLTGAITPVMVGTALAIMDGYFQWQPMLICFLFAGLMQITANFINDLFDYRKGTDREDRLGPERACAQGGFHPKRCGMASSLPSYWLALWAVCCCFTPDGSLSLSGCCAYYSLFSTRRDLTLYLIMAGVTSW